MLKMSIRHGPSYVGLCYQDVPAEHLLNCPLQPARPASSSSAVDVNAFLDYFQHDFALVYGSVV